MQKVIEEKLILLLLRSQSLRLVQSHLAVTETTGTSTDNDTFDTFELDPQQQHHTISPSSDTAQLSPSRATLTKNT